MNMKIIISSSILCVFWIAFYFGNKNQTPMTSAGVDDRFAAQEKYLSKNWKTPQQYILDKFKKYDIVLLSEDHAIRHNLELAQAMIPELYKAGVYNFGMEFGAEEDQELLDSLVNAPEYSENVARRIMFNYNVGWVFKEYMEVYRAAWKLNRSLPRNAKKFRVLNISYRFNWAGCDSSRFGVRTPTTYSNIFNRGNTEFFRANVIDKEILQKGQKILVLAGFGHSFSRYHTPYYDYRVQNFIRFDNNRMGNILYRKAPKKVFSILLHYPFESRSVAFMKLYSPANGDIERIMSRFERKSVGFDLINTPLGELRDSSSYSIGYKDFRLQEMADGYIFLKPLKETQGCTIDSNFLTDANWPEVVLNYPDKDVDKIPANKEEYLNKIARYVDIDWRYRNLQH